MHNIQKLKKTVEKTPKRENGRKALSMRGLIHIIVTMKNNNGGRKI